MAVCQLPHAAPSCLSTVLLSLKCSSHGFAVEWCSGPNLSSLHPQDRLEHCTDFLGRLHETMLPPELRGQLRLLVADDGRRPQPGAPAVPVAPATAVRPAMRTAEI